MWKTQRRENCKNRFLTNIFSTDSPFFQLFIKLLKKYFRKHLVIFANLPRLINFHLIFLQKFASKHQSRQTIFKMQAASAAEWRKNAGT
jgi:hypothetical protein